MHQECWKKRFIPVNPKGTSNLNKVHYTAREKQTRVWEVTKKGVLHFRPAPPNEMAEIREGVPLKY